MKRSDRSRAVSYTHLDVYKRQGAHLADVRRLVPGAELLVQLDEPLLPAVLAGELATSSGFGRLRAVDVEEVRRVLAQTIGSTGVDVVVHCCAADAPVGLLREAGASGISLDTALLGPRGWEAVAVAVDCLLYTSRCV